MLPNPENLWDGIKGIFWNFGVTRWALELKLTSTIFGISGPGKKKSFDPFGYQHESKRPY